MEEEARGRGRGKPPGGMSGKGGQFLLIFRAQISGGIRREKLKGTNGAKFTVFCSFSLNFADLRFSRGIPASRKRRFSQKTAGNRRFRRKLQIFAETGLSHLVVPFNSPPKFPPRISMLDDSTPYSLILHLTRSCAVLPKGPSRTKNNTESELRCGKKIRYGRSKTLQNVLRNACFSRRRSQENGVQRLRE